MERYFAEIKYDIVQRVVVAKSKKWCESNLGGEWVETFLNSEIKKYATKGDIYNKENDDFRPSYLLTDDQKKQYIFGNLFIRKNYLPLKDMKTVGHKHNFDHMTQFMKGSFHLKETTLEGEIIEEDYIAPAERLIKKDSIHEITALEDDSFYQCVFSHRNENGEVVEEATGSIIPYI